MRSEYSPHKRTRIALAYNSGLSRAAIAAKEGVPIRSISGIIKRYNSQRSGTSSPRSGRLHMLNERDIRHVCRIIEVDPFIKNDELLQRAGLMCDIRTLTHALQKRGILHKTALRRPKLTEEAARKRFAFAREHISKLFEWWKRWIFSDETTVACGERERQVWVFVGSVSASSHLIIYTTLIEQSERLDPEKVQPKGKPTRHSQMFWGAFSYDSCISMWAMHGDPESPRGGVNAARVLECLQEQLPTICSLGSIFAQDNAPIYTAILVQGWLYNWV